MKNICVYCSASDGIDEIYYRDAEKIGNLIGKNGFDLVYGGSDFGLMGAVSKSAKQNQAKICGVMPEKIYNMINHEGSFCDEFILTNNIRDRKAKMDELSDGVIALAGGYGTLDEVIEIIDLKIIGYNTKPIVFLNTNNYYENLFKFFEQIVKENFARKESLKLFYLAQTPEEAMDYINKYVPNKPPKSVEDIYVK